MTSTSSSSNDRMTDCAPVSCCGAICFVCAAEGLAAGNLVGDDCVGALTLVLLLSSWSWGNKKPSPAQRLHEGCALVLDRLVRHQRADELLRAFQRCS